MLDISNLVFGTKGSIKFANLRCFFPDLRCFSICNKRVIYPVASGSLTLLERKILFEYLDIGMYLINYVQINANFD